MSSGEVKPNENDAFQLFIGTCATSRLAAGNVTVGVIPTRQRVLVSGLHIVATHKDRRYRNAPLSFASNFDAGA